jgi:hypothetical protein
VQAFATAARTLVDELEVTAQVPALAAGTTTELTVEVSAGGATAGAVTPVTLAAPAVDARGTVAASPSVVVTTSPGCCRWCW